MSAPPTSHALSECDCCIATQHGLARARHLHDEAPPRQLTTLRLSVSQAYNSVFNEDPNPPRLIGNFPLLPLRTKTRGPAYTLPLDPSLPPAESPDPDSESYDILDEVLSLFRANTFFRNFEIQGPADRLLVYGIWFLSDCLSKIKPHATVREAQKDVMNLALDLNFAIPGDPAFPLNQVCSYSICSCPLHMGYDELCPLCRCTDCARRCTRRPGTDRTPSSSSSTCRRCGKSSRPGYSPGFTPTTNPSPASGG